MSDKVVQSIDIYIQPGTEQEVEEYLRRRFDNTIERVARVRKEDLKQVMYVWLGINGRCSLSLFV